MYKLLATLSHYHRWKQALANSSDNGLARQVGALLIGRMQRYHAVCCSRLSIVGFANEGDLESAVETFALTEGRNAGKLVIHAGQRSYIRCHSFASLVLKDLTKGLSKHFLRSVSRHASKGWIYMDDEEGGKGECHHPETRREEIRSQVEQQ